MGRYVRKWGGEKIIITKDVWNSEIKISYLTKV